jgi:hypothetical protein
MRSGPHCAGCDEAIWWGLCTRLAPGHGVLQLFFHRRCKKSYNQGLAKQHRTLNTLDSIGCLGDERGRPVPGALASRRAEPRSFGT